MPGTRRRPGRGPDVSETPAPEKSRVYGKLGQGSIHVRHLAPLADYGEAHQVDPVEDLRPVCPSCHAMPHNPVIPTGVCRGARRTQPEPLARHRRGCWRTSPAQGLCDGESACRRDSVSPVSRGWVAIHLSGPPGDIGRAGRPALDLAPSGVYIAARVTPDAGALLPHRCTLTCGDPSGVAHRRSAFCCTVLRVTSTGR